MTADDWHDQEDAALWGDHVLVSFQENAWVNSTTYQHHRKEQMKPMDAWCKKKGCRGVTFQDNLSSYSTYSSNEKFNDILPNFNSSKYYASHMSFALRSVDRNIGKVYKMRVYRAIRAEQTKRLREKRNSGDANATISPLSSQDKRTIICKSIDDTHEKLASYGTFYRAFIETTTWIPVTPLIDSPD